MPTPIAEGQSPIRVTTTAPLVAISAARSATWRPFMETFFKEMEEANARARKYVWSRGLTLLGVVLLATCLLLALNSGAFGRPPEGVPINAKLSEWFKEQRQMDNLPSRCCGGPEEEGGDGHYVFVRHEMGKWLVYVKEIEQWVVYPRAVDPELPNPTGRNIAWYTIGEDGSINWFCIRISIGI